MAPHATRRLALICSARMRALTSIGCLLIALTCPALALELPKEKGAARTVKIFDMFCLTQLPDLEGIERFAGFGEFAQIFGADLAPYKSGTPEEKVRAWRFHDLGAELILTARSARPDEAFVQKHPAFAKGKIVACSLLVPNDGTGEQVVGELKRRLGREPDESSSDAGARVSAWNSETDKAVTRVAYRAPAEKGRRDALSASVAVKD